MAVRLTCPECDKSFRVEDATEGDEVECPKCESTFAVPADDAPKLQRKKKKKESGSNTVLYAALGGGVALIVLVVVLVLVLGKGRNRGGDPPVVGPPGPPVTPGAPGTPAAQPGTGGGTKKVPADGIARIRIDHGINTVFHAGQGDDCYIAIASSGPKQLTLDEIERNANAGIPTPEEHLLHIYRVGTGEKTLSLPLSEPLRGFCALSPDAKHVATRAKANNTVRVFATTGTELGEFAPNPVPAGMRKTWEHELHWFTFLGAGRLLTTTKAGGYDIWTVPGFQRIGGRAPGRRPGDDDAVAGFPTGVPHLIALSADNKTIAQYNGAGITVIDVASGTEKVRTEAFAPKVPTLSLLARVALSPDGTRVYGVTDVTRDSPLCRLLQYDTGSGKLTKDTIIPRSPHQTGEVGIYPWGPNHMVIGRTGHHSRAVVHLPTGNVMHPVDVVFSSDAMAGMIHATSLAGRLWYTGREQQSQYLFGVLPSSLPAAPNEKKQWAIVVKSTGG